MTTESASTGIVLFGHGSRVEDANQGVRDLARQVQDAGPYHHVRAAFLELAQPDLNAAIAEAAAAGLQRVIVIPYFLTVGTHLRRDLPNLIAPLKQKFPRLAIEVGQSLESHPLMASIILGRVQEVIGELQDSH
jgi:sirohydrochlorin ferrochelatase